MLTIKHWKLVTTEEKQISLEQVSKEELLEIIEQKEKNIQSLLETIKVLQRWPNILRPML